MRRTFARVRAAGGFDRGGAGDGGGAIAEQGQGRGVKGAVAVAATAVVALVFAPAADAAAPKLTKARAERKVESAVKRSGPDRSQIDASCNKPRRGAKSTRCRVTFVVPNQTCSDASIQVFRGKRKLGIKGVNAVCVPVAVGPPPPAPAPTPPATTPPATTPPATIPPVSEPSVLAQVDTSVVITLGGEQPGVTYCWYHDESFNWASYPTSYIRCETAINSQDFQYANLRGWYYLGTDGQWHLWHAETCTSIPEVCTQIPV